MSSDRNMQTTEPRDMERVAESLVTKGDISGLTASECARYYVQACDSLGLNPASQPFAFLRLNGKEVMYATRGATDQLAATHRLNREIIDGPKVVDIAGTKLVYAVCRATHPNGRTETAIATVPLSDPVNVLMKCETKAKRRATLSILGLGLLDECEMDTIPAASQAPSALPAMRVEVVEPERPALPAPVEPPAAVVQAPAPEAVQTPAVVASADPPVDPTLRWRDRWARMNGRALHDAAQVSALTGTTAHAIQGAFVEMAADRIAALADAEAVNAADRWAQGLPETLRAHDAFRLIASAITSRRADLMRAATVAP